LCNYLCLKISDSLQINADISSMCETRNVMSAVQCNRIRLPRRVITPQSNVIECGPVMTVYDRTRQPISSPRSHFKDATLLTRPQSHNIIGNTQPTEVHATSLLQLNAMDRCPSQLSLVYVDGPA